MILSRGLKGLTSLILTLSALSMVACVKADRKGHSPVESDQIVSGRGFMSEKQLTEDLTDFNNRALFTAGAIEIIDTPSTSGSTRWRETNTIDLRMKMCGINIRDRQSRIPVNGQAFSINSELGAPKDSIIKVVNDCLHWVYRIPIDPLAASANLVLHFEIKSLGSDLGRIIRRVGFNPWDKIRNPEISSKYYDLTYFSSKEWGAGTWIVGEEKVLAAINGDLMDNQAVLDMSSVDFSSEEQVSAQSKVAKKLLAGLSAKDRKDYLRIQNEMKNKKGVYLNINLNAKPVVKLTDSNGKPFVKNITSGRFQVYMTFLADLNGKRYILNQYTKSMSDTKSGTANFSWSVDPVRGIQASLPLLLRGQVNFGRVEMLLKVKPLDLPGVKDYVALFDMGEYNQWLQKKSPDLKRINNRVANLEDLKNYVMQAENFKEYEKSFISGLGLGGEQSIKKARLFNFGPLTIRFIRIMPGETATDRTFQYSVESCITKSTTGAPVGEGLQFDITTEDQGVKHTTRRQTRINGCINWFGFVSHKYYHKEVLVEKIANIRFVGTTKKSQWSELVNKFEMKRVYYMNPWDEKFTFGWDGESLPANYPETIRKDKDNTPESRLYISDFKYDTMGFRYEIDKYMTLKVKKTVLFKMYPLVLKYNSIVYGRRGTEPLRDGIYLMKIALHKDYLDPASKSVLIRDKNPGDNVSENIVEKNGAPYDPRTDELNDSHKERIAIQEKLIRVIGGTVVTPIELEISDLRLMRIRNQFFIQLQTIDENKLRLATALDKALAGDGEKKGLQELTEVDKNYDKIFSQLDQLREIDEKVANEFHTDQLRKKKASELLKLNASRAEIEEGLLKMVIPGNLKKGTPEFEEKAKQALARFKQLDEARRKGASSKVIAMNDNWYTINRLAKAFGAHSKQLVDKDWSAQTDEENKGAEESDPFLKYFWATMDSDVTSNEEALNYVVRSKEDLALLKNSDFTTGTLAPHFPFDMLRNDGVGEDQSGLRARTFVGPLTFLLNTNGSPLRPTDILEESVCTTATCGVNDFYREGTSPDPIPSLFGVEDGQVKDLDRVTYKLGPSVNAGYENSKYYGYLRAYANWDVDTLIKRKENEIRLYNKKQELGSQISNFAKSFSLKFVQLNDNTNLEMKDIDWNCARDEKDPRKLSRCYSTAKDGVVSSKTFMNQLNRRRSPRAGYDIDLDGDNASHTTYSSHLSKEDLEKFMKYGWKDRKNIPEEEMKNFYRRMCFVLSQQMFSDRYLKEWRTFLQYINPVSGTDSETHSVALLEKKCHAQVDNLFARQSEDASEFSAEVYPPIIIERKLRIFDTTGQYVYRGGRSLNLNTSATFSLSHSKGFGTSRSASFKPLDLATGIAKAVTNSMVPDKALKKLEKGPIGLGVGIAKAIVGSLGFSINYGDNDGFSESDGTTVSTGTFLVSQQATIDIGIGEYERCFVARMHPMLIDTFLRDNKERFKNGFDKERDIETYGVMVCTGKKEKRCLPVKEKYYYLTQHFTEGDMLDTQDLSNHPWLLQLRGSRDFKVFASLVGAKKHAYAQASAWQQYYNKISSDIGSLKHYFKGDTDNLKNEFEVINQAEEPDWPLTTLGEAYFGALPTYPGLYTYVEDDSEHVKDWPYENADPSQSIRCSVSHGQ